MTKQDNGVQKHSDNVSDSGKVLVQYNVPNDEALDEQHPFLRIFVAYFVIFCNFLIYAEDPVAHSYGKCEIPAIGNDFSFIFTKYTGDGFAALKVFLWLIAIILALFVGKFVVHGWLLNKKMKISMFARDQGSWMIMFLCSLISLMIFSMIYNAFLSLDSRWDDHKITGYLGTKNHVFMRVAGVATWFGDFITAWMVTDMMLQDITMYPNWIPKFRHWWKQGWRRVILFWVFFIICTTIVIFAIGTDMIKWDKLNRGYFYTNELGRSLLASIILFMDFTIVMQDWEFPVFQTNQEVKLPGLNTAKINFEIPAFFRQEYFLIEVTGKWFQYGVLFVVMLLDMNMWKNQILYTPVDFAQYVDGEGMIWSPMDKFTLDNYKNQTKLMTYDFRNVTINPLTNRTYISDDFHVITRYRDYALGLKGVAFIPVIITFICFGVLIWIFGREGDFKDSVLPDGNGVQTLKITRLSSRKSCKRSPTADNKVESMEEVDVEPVPTIVCSPVTHDAVEDGYLSERRKKSTDSVSTDQV